MACCWMGHIELLAELGVWRPCAAGRQLVMPDDAEPWPVALFRAEAMGDDIDPVVVV